MIHRIQQKLPYTNLTTYFSGYIVVLRGTKYPKLVVDDNDFTVNRKSEGRTMWICSQYKKTGCKARLTTFGKIVKISGVHNHPKVYPDTTDATYQCVTFVHK